MELTIVLGTNTYSDWRRNGRWHEWISIANQVVLPAVVLGELYHGFRNGTKFEENVRKLSEFLKEPQVEIIPVTLRTAEIYGEFLHFLQSEGTPIPTNDLWIAANAHECHGRLASRDEHFRLLPLVDIVEG